METENKHKILVVDDEPMILDLISDVLTDSGYIVTTSPNGTEALVVLKTCKFDLILCDIAMPGQSGYDVLKEVKATDDNARFVFISAFNNQENIDKGFKLGAKGFLGKPFNNDDLVDVVKRTLSN